MSELPRLPKELREQLPAEVQAYLSALEGYIVLLRAQVEALQAQVKQHSQNPSRPPSSDPPGAPPRPPRAKSKRKRGGQPGHRGHQRALLDETQVSEIVQHWPTQYS